MTSTRHISRLVIILLFTALLQWQVSAGMTHTLALENNGRANEHFLKSWSALCLEEDQEAWSLVLDSQGRADGGRINALPRLIYGRGLGKRADMSVSFEMLNLSDAFTFQDSSGAGDIRLTFRLQTLKRGRSTGAMIFQTKLPDADETAGLGTDQTDFHFILAYSRSYEKTLFSLNIGLGILGKPDVDNLPSLINIPNLNFGLIQSNQGSPSMGSYLESSGQTDVMDYGLSLIHNISEKTDLTAEVYGFCDGGTFDDMCLGSLGVSRKTGSGRVAASLTKSLMETRPTGYTLGYTWQH